MWKRLFDGEAGWQYVLGAVIATALVAWIGARVARRFTAAAMKGAVGDTLVPTSPLVRGPLRLVEGTAFVLLFAVLIFPVA